MKKKRFTEEQIANALAQESTGQTIAEICRKFGVSEQTFYRWKKKFGAMAVAELRVFALATVELRNGIARILTHDLRAGADPYFDSPQQPSIAWEWAGQAWSDE